MIEKKGIVNEPPNRPPIINNIGKKAHLLTVQDSSKGGKSITGIWSRIKNCSKKCPYWKECNYHVISKTACEGKCYVKNLPELAKKSFVRLQSGKESEYNKMCMEYLDDFVNDPSITKQDKLTAIMKMGPVVWGTKMRTKVSQDEGTEFVVRFKKEGEK